MSKQDIVFFDVDNTLFDGYTQQYFVYFLRSKKKLDLLHMLVGAAWFTFYKLHLIRTEAWGMNMLLSRLKGLNKEEYNNLFDEYVETVVFPRLYPAALRQIKKHKQEGARVILLSTSLEPIVKRIAGHVDADQYVATNISFREGRCTGKIDGHAVSGTYKYQWAKEYLSQRGDIETVYVYADHYSDYPLLKIANRPIVVNPNKSIGKIAQRHKWTTVEYKL